MEEKSPGEIETAPQGGSFGPSWDSPLHHITLHMFLGALTEYKFFDSFYQTHPQTVHLLAIPIHVGWFYVAKYMAKKGCL